MRTILALLLACFTASGAQLTINVGTNANDGRGDTVRAALQKVNTNFTTLFTNVSSISSNLSAYTFSSNSIYVNEGGSLLSAKSAAQAGDTIFVGPGNYITTNSLSKSNVNWWLAPGCLIAMTNPHSLSLTNTGQPRAIFDDLDGPVSFSVDGYGDLLYHAGRRYYDTNGTYGDAFNGLPSNTSAMGAILITNALSDIKFRFRKISGMSSLANPSYPSIVWVENCKRVDITCEDIEDVAFGGTERIGTDEFGEPQLQGVNITGVYWALGDLYVNCKKIAATTYGVFGAQPTGSNHIAAIWLNSDSITNASSLATIYYSGPGASLRWKSWTVAKEIGGPNAVTGYGIYSGGSHYLTAQKVWGDTTGIAISLTAAQSCSFWCNVQKIQAEEFGIDMNSTPNASTTFDMHVNHILQTGPAATAGLRFDGAGTMRINGTRFSCTNLTYLPIVKAGTGRLELSGCNLNNLNSSGTNCAVCIITNSALSVAHSIVVGPTNKFGFLSMTTNSFRAPFTMVNNPSTNLLEITDQLRTNANAL